MKNGRNLKRALFFLIPFIAVIWVSGKLSGKKPEEPALQTRPEIILDAGGEVFETPLLGPSLTAYDDFLAKSSGHLILVNPDHAAPAATPGELVKVIDLANTLNRELLLNADALNMLAEMFNAAKKAGYDAFRVTEGHRTLDYQRALYDGAEDKSFVALPGYSEHHTGLAADISYEGVNIANSKQGTWLADNAHFFGFILRYPQNKEHITKIPHEPWHYRYVGQPHALICHENKLCFEEYINYLKEHKKMTAVAGAVTYTIHYLNIGDDLEIPPNHLYAASADNAGGVVVSVWAGAK